MQVLPLVKRFKKSESGNLSIMFSVGLTTLLMGVGLAIDISGVYSAKNHFQDVSDSAVLAAVRSGETDKSKLLEVARSSVESSFGKKRTQELEMVLSIDGSEVTVKIAGDHENYIMGIFGYKNTKFSVKSVSLIPGHNKKNIAFVLDTTASMEGTKLATLKSAMSALIETVETPLAANNVKISIVPFAEYVRIPVTNSAASWIFVQPPESNTYNVLDGENSVNCRTEGTGEGQYTVCDEEVFIEKTTVTSWKGCMGSRTNDYHKVADYQNRPLPGFNGTRGTCYDDYNFLLPLTSDIRDLETSIQDLKARGFTYIPAGLIWGWRTLSPNEPFTEAFGSDKDTEDLLVLMTDGANSKNLDDTVYDNTLYHWGKAASSVKGYEATNAAISNPLTLELCELIKADNIEIATIAYEVTDSDAINLMQSCASKPSNFYDAKNAEALKQAFKDIGSGNSGIRLVR